MIREYSTTLDELAFTSDTTNVQTVSHRTFTPERAISVDALAINARVIEALVNICSKKKNMENREFVLVV